eukprot:767956-Hanusia_phi.AAC.10
MARLIRCVILVTIFEPRIRMSVSSHCRVESLLSHRRRGISVSVVLKFLKFESLKVPNNSCWSGEICTEKLRQADRTGRQADRTGRQADRTGRQARRQAHQARRHAGTPGTEAGRRKRRRGPGQIDSWGHSVDQ